jgi:hypothetical protein
MRLDTPPGAVKAQRHATSAIAQSMILVRLRHFNKYARFNCLARVETPNHRDETETEADQQISITIMDDRTGAGPTASIVGSRYSFTPLKPSEQQVGEMVKTAIAELAPSTREGT